MWGEEVAEEADLAWIEAGVEGRWDSGRWGRGCDPGRWGRGWCTLVESVFDKVVFCTNVLGCTGVTFV